MPPLIIAPSILSANFQHLQKEVEDIEAHAEWVQVDVMDGHFVPNLSFGAPVMKWINTNLVLDVHLMVTNPADRIEEFVAAGANHITFHAEVVPTLAKQQELISAIHKCGCTAGIALNPDTPLHAIEGLLSEESSTDTTPDLLLCMTVFPGFGGQEFIADVLPKITEARAHWPELQIQVDGGINADTARLARKAGANNLVAGSYIFKNNNRGEAIRSLREE